MREIYTALWGQNLQKIMVLIPRIPQLKYQNEDFMGKACHHLVKQWNCKGIKGTCRPIKCDQIDKSKLVERQKSTRSGGSFPLMGRPNAQHRKRSNKLFSFRFQLRFHFFDIKKISTICGNKWHDCKLFRFTAQILYQFYFETQLCNSKTKKKLIYTSYILEFPHWY